MKIRDQYDHDILEKLWDPAMKVDFDKMISDFVIPPYDIYDDNDEDSTNPIRDRDDL